MSISKLMFGKDLVENKKKTGAPMLRTLNQRLARSLESLRRFTLPASSGRAVFQGSSYSYLGSDL